MGDIDVVYVLGPTPDSDFLEFRLSLRSICKYYNDSVRNIVTIGHKPGWLVGTNHVPFLDAWAAKDATLIAKTLYACYLKEISDPFLLMSDDIYLMRPLDEHLYKTYAEDMTEEAWRHWASNRQIWPRRNYATREIVKHRYSDPNPPFLDPHVGIPVFKDHYARVMLQVGWEAQNSQGINTNYYQYACLYDNKVTKVPEKLGVRMLNKIGNLPTAEKNKDMLWFNISEDSLFGHPEVKNYLMNTFDVATKYEAPGTGDRDKLEETYMFAKSKYMLSQSNSARAYIK